jgi:hypothetical protein
VRVATVAENMYDSRTAVSQEEIRQEGEDVYRVWAETGQMAERVCKEKSVSDVSA